MLSAKWLNTLFVITCIVKIPFANSLASNPSRTALGTPSSSREALQNDVFAIFRKDLSPDILATSIPVIVTSQNERINSQLPNKGLLLRSSSRNISGLEGYSLFALPILSSELAEILSTAEADLQSRDGRASTLLYRVNTTKWSFSVIASNNSVQYASIRAALQRFVKLSIPASTSDDIVTTRVGVLFNEDTPVADINITPCQPVKNGSFTPFVGLGQIHNLSQSEPVEIVKVTPQGSTCAYEHVNETAVLAPFQNVGHVGKLRKRQFEGEILAHIGQTAFAMTLNLWRRRDGLPVEVKIWALKAIVCIGYWQFVAATLLTAVELGMTGSDDVSRGFFDPAIGFDTGLYVVGRLVARFVVKIVQTAIDSRYEIFTIDAWKEIFAFFLGALQEKGEYDDGWAMDGVIMGTGANGNDSADESGDRDRNIVATWQIWMGDYDEFDY